MTPDRFRDCLAVQPVIRAALAAATLAAGIMSAQADDLAKAGTKGQLSRTLYGCAEISELKTTLMIMDRQGIVRARDYGDAHGCIPMQKGTRVVVEDAPGPKFACMKPDGQGKCLWTINTGVVPD